MNSKLTEATPNTAVPPYARTPLTVVDLSLYSMLNDKSATNRNYGKSATSCTASTRKIERKERIHNVLKSRQNSLFTTCCPARQVHSKPKQWRLGF